MLCRGSLLRNLNGGNFIELVVAERVCMYRAVR